MSAPMLTRSSLRTAGAVAGVSATAFAAFSYYQGRSIAHAEQLPSDAQAGLKKMAWSGFTELKLESAEMVSHNVRKLRFSLPENQNITGIAPVTSLLTRHTPDGGFIPVFRPYTPVSANDEAGFVTFMIKKYPNGKGSGKMHSMVPGDTMKFKPLHEFDYKPNQYSTMTFIAGGSGITPIYQLTNAILTNPNDKTKIALVYANNSEEDILLRHEFDDLEAKYPGRFSATYTVTKPSQEKDAKVNVGYVNKDMLVKAMPDKKSAQTVKVLVSGPPPMTDAVAGAKGFFGWTQGSVGGILKELGYTSEDVHKF